MKEKAIEKTPAPKTKKKGWWTILQVVQGIVVLNIFKNKVLQRRHCFNPTNSEYATWHANTGVWHAEKVPAAYEASWDGSYGYSGKNGDSSMSSDDHDRLKEILDDAQNPYTYYRTNLIDRIYDLEQERDRKARQTKEERRFARVTALMDRVPDVPTDLRDWIDKQFTGGENWCIKDRDTKKWVCSACGGSFELKNKPRNNDNITCPECNREIKYLSRKRKVEMVEHFCLIQPMDTDTSVCRHFVTEITFDPGVCEHKNIWIDEEIRVILNKQIDTLEFNRKKKAECDIYYKQWSYFDNKGNPPNKREYVGALYDAGIMEAFKDTSYESWSRLFTQMAAAGQQCNWNAMMAAVKDKEYMQVAEMLFRGRFYRMLTETSMQISYWDLEYIGYLDVTGRTIEEVFGIADRQKINRIRDCNGGGLILKWMQYSEEKGEKISEKLLTWAKRENITPGTLKEPLTYMSAEQAMNYIEKQKKEQYKGKSTRVIVDQYADYIRMCNKLKKKLEDEMIYKPRELKRRHDEAVEEIKVREIEIDSEEYSERYPEAEDVLKEIKKKFEYRGTEYFIMVPERIYDIVCEGRSLHHCVGSTDRYFDRMAQHETYICFLRKVEEPDKPFYTIEVEPGGTIRQHRGMFDEEPELETVKPFLKEWQKEIRKRMSEEDHARAKQSKVLREANIRELQEKNNTRVLQGLMEDFMEAV